MIIFLISHRNHMLWPIIWTVSSRRFRWGVTTYVFIAELMKIIPNYHQILDPLIYSSGLVHASVCNFFIWIHSQNMLICTANKYCFALPVRTDSQSQYVLIHRASKDWFTVPSHRANVHWFILNALIWMQEVTFSDKIFGFMNTIC